jgi:hypothetical protein
MNLNNADLITDIFGHSGQLQRDQLSSDMIFEVLLSNSV